MSTENLTAEQALDEVLNRAFPTWGGGWRHKLSMATLSGVAESEKLNNDNPFTLGDLRRWSAPLLSIPL